MAWVGGGLPGWVQCFVYAAGGCGLGSAQSQMLCGCLQVEPSPPGSPPRLVAASLQTHMGVFITRLQAGQGNPKECHLIPVTETFQMGTTRLRTLMCFGGPLLAPCLMSWHSTGGTIGA